jgi:hypothetical protein
MATKHMIGFEWGVHEDNMTAGYDNFMTSPKRSGAYSFRISSTSFDFYYWLKLPLASNLSEFYLQYAFYFDGSPNADRALLKWCAGTTVLGGLKFNYNSGKLELYTGNYATKVGTGNTVINASRWYVVELYIKIGDSGALELRVDGITEATFSGDTKPGSDTYVDNIVWGNVSVNSLIDDIIVNDTTGTLNNSWPNGAKIVLLKPNGDGGTKQWTPSAGSDHYALVDEVPASATDYLQSASAGQVEELDVENLPAEALTIGAVKVDMWGLKGSISTPNQVKLGVKSGGANYMSSAKDLGLAQGKVSHLLDADPADGNAFTPSEVNALQAVLESV